MGGKLTDVFVALEVILFCLSLSLSLQDVLVTCCLTGCHYGLPGGPRVQLTSFWKISEHCLVSFYQLVMSSELFTIPYFSYLGLSKISVELVKQTFKPFSDGCSLCVPDISQCVLPPLHIPIHLYITDPAVVSFSGVY